MSGVISRREAQAVPGEIPVGHIQDPASMERVCAALTALHPHYRFGVTGWEGHRELPAQGDALTVHFIVVAEGAQMALAAGDAVRGGRLPAPSAGRDRGIGVVQTAYAEPLWPGDVICLSPEDPPAALAGRGVAFTVWAPVSGYPVPRLVLLRGLEDIPGGCAAYPGAFRREALPPQRPTPDAPDRRGVNRLNQHTLDMRTDRHPPPIRHYHGPIPMGNGQRIPHSETAILLPRSVYGLPEMAGRDHGHLVIYRRPVQDPQDRVTVPVRPGSVVVTPASPQVVMGHAFENTFAMLLAIPGFVAPYHLLPAD